MDISVVDEALTPYKTFSERDTLVDYNQGANDGAREFPDSNQSSFAAYENRRIGDARTALTRYVRRLREVTDRIDRTVVDRELERQTEYVNRLDSMNREKVAELSLLKQTTGPGSKDWIRQEAEVTVRQRAYQDEEFRAGRPPNLSLHQPIARSMGMPWKLITPYLFFLTVLALFEIPINHLAVRLAFGFGEGMSYVIALFIGTSFVILAHFTGLQLRLLIGGPKMGGGMTALRFLITAGVILLALIMIYVLFQMRGQVASLTGNSISAREFLASTAQAAPQIGFWKALLKGLQAILPWTGGGGDDTVRYAQFGFLMLNFMVYGSGVVLSFYRHDPDPVLERAWQRQHSAEQDMHVLQRQYEDAVAHIEHRYSQRIISRQNRADMIVAEVQRLKSEKARLLQQADGDMRLVLDVLILQLSAYQQGNVETRRSRAPSYFGHNGLLHLGETLLLQA